MKVKLLLFMALMITLTIPSIAQANLLNNPGFETWGPWGPGGSEVPADWWHMFSDPDVTGTKESTIVKGGSYSGKTSFAGSGSGWGGWGQKVTLAAGSPFYAFQPLNIPTGLGGSNSLATLEITFKDASDATIGSPIKVSRSAATTGWEALEYSTLAAPAGTASVNYVILLETWGSGSGVVYWDNAYADTVPIPEPSTLLLLGTGLVGVMGFVKRKKS
jgi:hypothetical protein